MKKFDLEFTVGLFLLIGIVCLGYISVKLGRLEVMSGNYYTVHATFENAGGIKTGSSVEIAGVGVGRVKTVKLDNYQALVTMEIEKDIKLQDDVEASIRTKGLIGEKFVKITPGGSDKIIPNGGTIRETESAVDVEELVAKYIFGKV